MGKKKAVGLNWTAMIFSCPVPPPQMFGPFYFITPNIRHCFQNMSFSGGVHTANCATVDRNIADSWLLLHLG